MILNRLLFSPVFHGIQQEPQQNKTSLDISRMSSNTLYYTSSLARSAKRVVLITVDLTINLSTPIFFNIESLTPSVSVQITDQQREMCAQSNEKHRECVQKVLVDLMTDRPSTFYNTLRHYLSLENYRLNSEITKSA